MDDRRKLIAERRRKHLVAIIDRHFAGNAAALARAVDRSPAWIWQVVHEYRRMGERMARHIERCLELESGALDGEQQVRVNPQVVEASAEDSLSTIERLHHQGWLTPRDLAVLGQVAERLADKAREADPE